MNRFPFLLIFFFLFSQAPNRTQAQTCLPLFNKSQIIQTLRLLEKRFSKTELSPAGQSMQKMLSSGFDSFIISGQPRFNAMVDTAFNGKTFEVNITLIRLTHISKIGKNSKNINSAMAEFSYSLFSGIKKLLKKHPEIQVIEINALDVFNPKLEQMLTKYGFTFLNLGLHPNGQQTLKRQELFGSENV